MESTSAHYWRVFLSLVNCIAEVCTYSISYCCVQSLLSTGGSALIMNFSILTQVSMCVFPTSFTCDMYKAHVYVRTPVCSHLLHWLLCAPISLSCGNSDRYNLHPHSRTHFHPLALYGVCVLPWHLSSLVNVLCWQLSCGGTGISEWYDDDFYSHCPLGWVERKWPYLVNSLCIVSLIGDTTALVVLPPAHLFATSLSKTVFTVCMPALG